MSSLKAYMRMEERYEELNIVVGSNSQEKSKVLGVIDEVIKDTKQKPNVLSKGESVYVEFHDDVYREGGEFFTKVLNKLNITNCEKGI